MALIEHNKRIEMALAFIADARIVRPNLSNVELIDEASMRFNLTPLDAIHLKKIFMNQGNDTNPTSNTNTVTDIL